MPRISRGNHTRPPLAGAAPRRRGRRIGRGRSGAALGGRTLSAGGAAATTGGRALSAGRAGSTGRAAAQTDRACPAPPEVVSGGRVRVLLIAAPRPAAWRYVPEGWPPARHSWP